MDEQVRPLSGRRFEDNQNFSSTPPFLDAYGLITRIREAKDGEVITLRKGTNMRLVAAASERGTGGVQVYCKDIVDRLVRGGILTRSPEGGDITFVKHGDGFSGESVNGCGLERGDFIWHIWADRESRLNLINSNDLRTFVEWRVGALLINFKRLLKREFVHGAVVVALSDKIFKIASVLQTGSSWEQFLTEIKGLLSIYFESPSELNMWAERLAGHICTRRGL